ncbi:hypothetical protein BH20ACI2_BH20ACI2_24410 [soil metagenome]
MIFVVLGLIKEESVMRKHLFGLAIFFSIVATAVVIYGIFNLPGIPVIPTVKDRPTLRDRQMKSLVTRVLTAEYDARSEALVADIELKWTDAGSPPDRPAYRVFLSDATRSPHWAIESDLVQEPFSKARRNVKRVTFLPSAIATFSNLDNIYIYVEAADEVKTLASHEERLSKAVSVPVLKVHN